MNVMMVVHLTIIHLSCGLPVMGCIILFIRYTECTVLSKTEEKTCMKHVGEYV